jgi:acetyl esterase/lipase
MRRTTQWFAVALAVATGFLAAWIVVPAPTYFLLTFDVGAPEESAWLIVASVSALALAISVAPRSIVTRVTIGCASLALVLSGSVFARLPGTISRFDVAMKGMSREPPVPLRAHPVVVADLFRGIRWDSTTVHRDVLFASPAGTPLRLDVYQPLRRGGFPIVVQIYGGAWQRGAPSSNANFAQWLASSGYVVVAIDYRHAPAFIWPAQIEDVDSALVWVRDHAAEYDGDTSRVVLLGRSAGAQLAMLAAYRAVPPVHIRGVVSYYGPTDLPDAYRHPPHPDPIHTRSVEEVFLGGTPATVQQKYVDASPVTYATRVLPPTLLIYGQRDHIVEPRYGAELAHALAAHGTPVAYLEIPWADHAYDAVFNGPSSQLALFYTERFIRWATTR